MNRALLIIGCVIAAVLVVESSLHDPNVRPVVQNMVQYVDRGVERVQGQFSVQAATPETPVDCNDADADWAQLEVELPRRNATVGDISTASADELTVLVIVQDVTPTGRIRSVDLLGSLELEGVLLGNGDDLEFVAFDPPALSVTGVQAARRSPFRDLVVCYVPTNPVPTQAASPIVAPTRMPTESSITVPTNTAVVTATDKPTATIQATSTAVPTRTLAPTNTATSVPPTATLEPTVSDTAAAEPTPTSSSTPEQTPSETAEPTVTETALPSATDTAVPTATETLQPTATDTPEPTTTATPEPTATETLEPTATNTREATATATPEPTSTSTSTSTATATPEPTATETAEPTATNTSAPTATETSIPTATDTPPPAATETVAPTSTETVAPTSTEVASATPTATGAVPVPETPSIVVSEQASPVPASPEASPIGISPTPTPLYDSAATGSFSDWALAPGWTGDGTLWTGGDDEVGWVAPPVAVAGTNDYGVEFSFVLGETDNCPRSFGVALRGSADGYVAGGIEWNCDASAVIWIGQEDAASIELAPGLGRHTMRVEAVGSRIALTLDGQLVLESEIDESIAGEQIAFWSAGVPISIESVQVFTLEADEGDDDGQ